MRHTVGGHKCSEYEKIQATESGDYLNRKLYSVEGLPGIWRRVKEPKVKDAATVGVLACWFEGGIVFLEPGIYENEELLEGSFVVASTFSDKAKAEYLSLIGANPKYVVISNGKEEKPELEPTNETAQTNDGLLGLVKPDEQQEQLPAGDAVPGDGCAITEPDPFDPTIAGETKESTEPATEETELQM